MSRRKQRYLDSPAEGSTFIEMLLDVYPQHRNRLKEYRDDCLPAVAIDSALDYIAAQMDSDEMTDAAALGRATAIGVNEPSISDEIAQRIQEIDRALQYSLAERNERIVGGLCMLTMGVALWSGIDALSRADNGLFFDQLTAQQFTISAITSWLSVRALQRIGYC